MNGRMNESMNRWMDEWIWISAVVIGHDGGGWCVGDWLGVCCGMVNEWDAGICVGDRLVMTVPHIHSPTHHNPWRSPMHQSILNSLLLPSLPLGMGWCVGECWGLWWVGE